MSTVASQGVLGWGSYRTAWTCLHKLRRAMIRRGRERLARVVEVDESYLGGDEKAVLGRHIVGKALIVLAAEEDGQGIGRIRLRHSGRFCSQIDSVYRGQHRARQHRAYGRLVRLPAATNGRISTPYRQSKGHSDRASELLPRFHQVFSLPKRWLEISRLRAELARVTMERDILGKATAFCVLRRRSP